MGTQAKELLATVDVSEMTNLLAQEIAAGINTLREIRKRHGIPKKKMKRMLKEPAFRNLIGEHAKKYNAPGNTVERIEDKAAYAVEDAIADMHGITVNGNLAPKDRIDAFKSMSKLSGAEKSGNEKGGPAGQVVSVTFNLGGAKEVIDIIPDKFNRPILDADVV